MARLRYLPYHGINRVEIQTSVAPIHALVEDSERRVAEAEPLMLVVHRRRFFVRHRKLGMSVRAFFQCHSDSCCPIADHYYLCP
jgi:hypothetical protein